MIPMEPRKPGCSVVEGKDITPEKVRALANAADACWDAILAHDLERFSLSFSLSFAAQVAMFPGMVRPTYIGHENEYENGYIQQAIDKYSSMDDVLAWKMPGAGGGGYLALVVTDAQSFMAEHEEAFDLHIRRE